MPSGGAPTVGVGEPNPGTSIPVEPNGGHGGGMVPLYGGNPLPHLLADLTSWFTHGDNHGGGYPPLYAAPPASGDGLYITPGDGEASPSYGDGVTG
jgi:hypothetical protein